MDVKNLSKKQSQALYSIITIIVIAVACTIILQFYKSNNSKEMLEASTAYQKALIANENINISLETKASKFQAVVDNYPNTSFGIFASWQLADLYITPTKLDTTSFKMNIGNMPKAIQALQQSINTNPKDSLTNITKTRLAKLYIATKEPQKAIETLQSISSLENSAYPLVILGQAYNEEGDKTKAIQAWQKALQDQDSSPEFKQIITQLINNSK